MSKKNKSQKVTNSTVPQVQNGLSDVIMGGINPLNNASQINQTDTFFSNTRNYLISNMRQILSQMYVEHGLIQAIVDVPVDDAFRGGFDIKTEQLNEDEIRKLKTHMRLKGDVEVVKQAFKWSRLYGGGGIIAMTGQKHDTKLDKRQNQLEGLDFRAVDMWELFSDQQNIDDDTRRLDLPKDKDFCFSYYSVNLHNSRVIILKGRIAPAFIRPRLRGWGFSAIESLISSINQFLKTKNLTFEVLDEFKLDIFKIKGFNTSLLTKDGTDRILKRTAMANTQKNFQNALTMDTEDDHQSKQLNFSGISEIMKDIRMQIASDMKMPMTKLFGISAAGFNSGEDDIEVYNSMVESEVRSKAEIPCLEITKLRCEELFGFEPDDLEICFHPLRILSHEQEEIVKTQKMNRVIMAHDKALITTKEAQESINRDNLVPVKVDVSGGELLDKESQLKELAPLQKIQKDRFDAQKPSTGANVGKA